MKFIIKGTVKDRTYFKDLSLGEVLKRKKSESNCTGMLGMNLKTQGTWAP